MAMTMFEMRRRMMGTGSLNPWKNLVFGYKLDGNALDTLGNNDGTIVGNVDFVPGKYNQGGTDFYRSFRYVQSSNSQMVGLTDITLACYVKIPSLDAGKLIALTGAGYVNATTGYGIYISNNRIGEGTLYTAQIRESIHGVYNIVHLQSTDAVMYDEYAHIALTISDNIARIYINGIFNNQTIIPSTLNYFNVNSPFYIGRFAIPSLGDINSVIIDECAFFNKSMNEQELLVIMKGIP